MRRTIIQFISWTLLKQHSREEWKFKTRKWLLSTYILTTESTLKIQNPEEKTKILKWPLDSYVRFVYYSRFDHYSNNRICITEHSKTESDHWTFIFIYIYFDNISLHISLKWDSLDENKKLCSWMKEVL